MGSDDAELMLAFRKGDESAFVKLIERYQVPLINHFYRLLFDRHIAEDLTQEVFIRLDQHKASYEPVAKFATYLYRIARNCWIDHLRRTKHEREVLSLDAADEDELSFHDQVPAPTEPPVEAARRSELAEEVGRTVELLPESQREVFVLAVIDGMKYLEIAEVLGVPVGTVKSRMHNALRTLRGRLAPRLAQEACRGEG